MIHETPSREAPSHEVRHAESAGVDSTATVGVERGEARRPRFTLGVIITLTILLFIAFTAYQYQNFFASHQRPRALSKLYPVPSFELRNEEGDVVTDEDLRGKIWVADFIFTSCSGICPQMASVMYQLQERLHAELPPELRDRVRLVSFSVDPERDTVEKLAAYAKMANARSDFWMFLRGKPGEVKQIAGKEGFRLGVAPAGEDAPPDEAFIHSSKLVLVDAQGTIRGYFEGVPGPDGESELGSVYAAILRLFRESS